MSILNELVTFEYENAYDSAYDFTLKKQYSIPKIYDANGDINKRWYVYFSFRNPESGRMERMTPYYGEAHKLKSKGQRRELLDFYRLTIFKFLKMGFNPFADNSELLDEITLKEEDKAGIVAEIKIEDYKPFIKEYNNPIMQSKEPKYHSLEATIGGNISTSKASEELETLKVEQNAENNQIQENKHHEEPLEEGMLLKDAFDFSLSIKKNQVKPRTLDEYRRKSEKFQLFISEKYPEINYAHQLKKNIAVDFLNQILIQSSSRNRNNYRLDISSLMQVLEDNEIISANFIKNIKVLKSKPERHKTYSDQQLEDIFNYLEEKDPLLLLYIKFISYNLLRPVEVNRLKVGDINLKEKKLTFKAKNSPLKTKIIPEILIKDLPNLEKMDPKNPLFTPEGYGLPWDADNDNRRDNFSKRYKKVVKDYFKFDKDFTLYSFRHTFITKLYHQLAKQYSPFEAKSRLMSITGHNTMEALEKYLRQIDAQLPEDYSNLLEQTNE